MRTQLIFPLPIYETPVLNQMKRAGQCMGRGHPAALQMSELQVLQGKQDIKATWMDGSLLVTFLSTWSLCLKILHRHAKTIFFRVKTTHLLDDVFQAICYKGIFLHILENSMFCVFDVACGEISEFLSTTREESEITSMLVCNTYVGITPSSSKPRSLTSKIICHLKC